MELKLKTQSAVIIDRAELRKESLRLAARCNELSRELEAFGELTGLDGARLDKYLMIRQEYDQLEGVITFIQGLLEEEKVNPEDYGVSCVEVG